jgi:flagellar hook-basal body complex protein FliE
MSDIRIAPATLPVAPAPPASPLAPRGGGDGFGETLTRAVAAVNDLQLQARDASLAVASGAQVDSAQAFVAIEKANISFQFALQIRNKLLEAYSEVMRMTV